MLRTSTLRDFLELSSYCFKASAVAGIMFYDDPTRLHLGVGLSGHGDPQAANRLMSRGSLVAAVLH